MKGLKECPFCGSEAVVHDSGCGDGFYVECKNCCCALGYYTIYDLPHGEYDTEQEAINAWNIRR